MTETEKKALALVNELGVYHYPSLDSASMSDVRTTLCRAIEQHEAFRQEVSDVVKSLCNTVLMSHGHHQLREMLSRRFIIAKPDPLVEAIQAADEAHPGWESASDYAQHLRAALAARGLEIREKQP